MKNRITIPVIVVFCISLFISCTPPDNLYRSGWMFGSSKRNRIIRTAKRYLGVRYRRGGSSPRGFDCSGYVQYVYKKNGLRVPRTAKSQYYKGTRISLYRARPGDLVFFRTSRRKRISHVGIYIGNNKFIHAPRTGKRISYASISNKYWKRRYLGAVTYFRRSGRRGR